MNALGSIMSPHERRGVSLDLFEKEREDERDRLVYRHMKHPAAYTGHDRALSEQPKVD